MIDLIAIFVIFMAGNFTGILIAAFLIAAHYQDNSQEENNHE